MPKQDKTRHYKPPAQRKSVVIPIRTTREQRARFTLAARKAGTTVSDWLRDLGDAACGDFT